MEPVDEVKVTVVFSMGSVRSGDDVLEVGVGVDVLLLILTLLVMLFSVLGAVVFLVAADGDGDKEGTAASDGVVVTVVEDEVGMGGVGVLEFGDMNSFKTPAGTDIMGAPVVSKSFMAGGRG